MMKKRIVYNEQVKTLMLTVEAIRGYGDQVCVEEITYSEH